MNQAHIFISHVEQDGATAEQLARALEDSGYAAWYYERDSAPGASYLIQTHDAIVAAQAVVLLISPDALAKPDQVTREIVRAHESHRPVVPLLIDLTDAEYKQRQPEWKQLLGAATSVVIPDDGIAAILPRIIRGLEALGVTPGARRQTIVPTSRPPGVTPAVIATGAIAAFLVLAALVNLARAVSPAPGSDEFNLYAGFPTVRIANVLGNAANGALAVAILLALRRQRTGTARTIRKTAAAIVGVSVTWLVWVLAGTTGGANWSLVPAQDQNTFITTVVTVGAFSLMLPAAIYALNRRKGVSG